MKSLKTYLIIVSLFLTVSIGAGIYVWYLYQKVRMETKTQSFSEEYTQPISRNER